MQTSTVEILYATSITGN